jgi:phosphoribosyl-ATP pyrophosphohydrolase/phosphoribosyl-AMP cyclohydrolase
MRDRSAALTASDIDGLDWDKGDGLIPAIVQDADTLQTLMLGYMSREALAATFADGFATFFSRSRGRLWRKGESSGNTLTIRAVHADCDGDALLILAEPQGPTCHEGTTSCFVVEGPAGIGWLGQLARIVAERRFTDAEESYTARLLRDGPMRLSQKVGEEGVELALAGAAGDRGQCIEETADLLYHLAVLMEMRGFDWDDVGAALKRRHSG